jgi:hypothetical protein
MIHGRNPKHEVELTMIVLLKVPFFIRKCYSRKIFSPRTRTEIILGSRGRRLETGGEKEVDVPSLF